MLRAALACVDGRRCVREALGAAPIPAGPVWVAAVGKAAAAMALGAHDALAGRIERTLIISTDALLAPLAARPHWELQPGAHPLPDERSLAAGARLWSWVEEVPPAAQPLFLISGGASSLVEVLKPGTTLAELRELNAQGHAAGIDIATLNARRAALSCIKAGGLAARLAGRPARALLMSDVPRDDPEVIGSGLLGRAGGGPDAVERQVIASITQALAGAADCARELGLTVHVSGGRFAGEAARLAARFTHELLLGQAQLCLWGGESTVRLPPRPGRGGRNQQLALAAARLLAGQPDLLLLAAGTDGIDGVTEDAGALVDGETCARITLAALDPEAALAAADAGTALAASGDLLHTGPTGTNVGDLVLGLKMSVAQARGRARGGAAARVL
ncbi:MAG: DUF4147 domain-containing protein [Gammaproteobacteria bacterium]|nr:DUF4147 domain-containing protein [Gammaproteobacteria bacterium]